MAVLERSMSPTEGDPPPSSQLQIRLFGGFDAYRGGTPLPRARTRKEVWLLALLTFRPGQSVDRSWLAGTLWPDTTEERALAYLRSSLYDLRRVLGPDAHRLYSAPSRTVRLDLAGASVDMLEFDSLIDRGDGGSLERATALYRGPLLEGCTEEWVRAERQPRHEACLQALETLAAARGVSGDIHESARLLHRAIGLDPLRESAHRALMGALARCGDYAAVDRQYRDLRRALLDEVNAEPAQETRALYERLRAEGRAPAPHRELLRAPPRRRLPCPLTPLVGRLNEIREVSALVRRSRLVSLTGTGGVGKTRLAIAVAEAVSPEFEDGVWFVDLAQLADPAGVPRAIAGALGVLEEPGRPLLETLCDFTRERVLLIVLDNCEHLLEACADLTQTLLEGAPGARLLTTSREALGGPCEVAWRVSPLGVPGSDLAGREQEDPATLLRFEAAQLFVDRAGAASSAFRLRPEHCASIARLCRLLDGLPLALELAAAWVRSLTVEDIAVRLSEHLDLPAAGRARAPRHRSLHAALDWSYKQLDPQQARLLTRLAAFSGGWTTEAAEAVCAADSISEDEVLGLQSSLVEKSLVIYEDQECEGRYRLLETVRQYAREQLPQEGEAEAMRARHADYFLQLAERAEPELRGVEQVLWCDRVEREHDNLRAALTWFESSEGRTDEHLRLVGALWRFWFSRGHYREGRQWAEKALSREHSGAARARAKAVLVAGDLARLMGDFAAADPLLEQSVALARVGDQGWVASSALFCWAMLAITRKQYARASERARDSLTFARMVGDPWLRALPLVALGLVALQQNDPTSARSFFEESLVVSHSLHDRFHIARSTVHLGAVALQEHDCERARGLFRGALMGCRDVADRRAIAACLSGLAAVAAPSQPHRAAILSGAAEALREAMGSHLTPIDHDGFDLHLPAIRAHLGEESFAAAWAAGRAMTLGQAIICALEEEAAGSALKNS